MNLTACAAPAVTAADGQPSSGDNELVYPLVPGQGGACRSPGGRLRLSEFAGAPRMRWVISAGVPTWSDAHSGHIGRRTIDCQVAWCVGSNRTSNRQHILLRRGGPRLELAQKARHAIPGRRCQPVQAS